MPKRTASDFGKMLVPFTPRNSFSLPQRPTPPLLALPPELRTEIWEYVLGDAAPSTFHIRKHYHDNWYVYYEKGESANITGLLRVCRTIYLDASAILYNTWRPKFVIPHSTVKYLHHCSEEKQMGLTIRPIEKVKHLLHLVNRMDFQIAFEINKPYEQCQIIALLRWIRTVVSRRAHAPKDVGVYYHATAGKLQPRGDDGIFKPLAHLMTQKPVEMWYAAVSDGSFGGEHYSAEPIAAPVQLKSTYRIEEEKTETVVWHAMKSALQNPRFWTHYCEWWCRYCHQQIVASV